MSSTFSLTSDSSFCARAFLQVYYVGLLAGKNDLKLLEETKEGRNINRHYYSNEEIAEEVQRHNGEVSS